MSDQRVPPSFDRFDPNQEVLVWDPEEGSGKADELIIWASADRFAATIELRQGQDRIVLVTEDWEAVAARVAGLAMRVREALRGEVA